MSHYPESSMADMPALDGITSSRVPPMLLAMAVLLPLVVAIWLVQKRVPVQSANASSITDTQVAGCVELTPSFSETTSSTDTVGIRGVVRKDGSRLANALVQLSIEGGANAQTAYMTSDAAGEFFLPMPPGDYRLTIVGRTAIQGYVPFVHERADPDCSRRYHVGADGQRERIELIYARPVFVKGFNPEESLTADRRMTWGCDFPNAEYSVTVSRRTFEPGPGDDVLGLEETGIGGMFNETWRIDTSLVLPVSRFKPGHYEVSICAQDRSTKKSLCSTNGPITFWVGPVVARPITEAMSTESNMWALNAAVHTAPDKLVLVRQGPNLAAVKLTCPNRSTLREHRLVSADGVQYRVSDTISYESWYQGDGSNDLTKDNVIHNRGILFERMRIGREYSEPVDDQTLIKAGPLSVSWSFGFWIYSRPMMCELCQTDWDDVSEINLRAPGLEWTGGSNGR